MVLHPPLNVGLDATEPRHRGEAGLKDFSLYKKIKHRNKNEMVIGVGDRIECTIG
jgi:hypothetical protein